eukprot:3313336-Amphidinium_carterae.1
MYSSKLRLSSFLRSGPTGTASTHSRPTSVPHKTQFSPYSYSYPFVEAVKIERVSLSLLRLWPANMLVLNSNCSNACMPNPTTLKMLEMLSKTITASTQAADCNMGTVTISKAVVKDARPF